MIGVRASRGVELIPKTWGELVNLDMASSKASSMLPSEGSLVGIVAAAGTALLLGALSVQRSNAAQRKRLVASTGEAV